jgi:hypothetical protein
MKTISAGFKKERKLLEKTTDVGLKRIVGERVDLHEKIHSKWTLKLCSNPHWRGYGDTCFDLICKKCHRRIHTGLLGREGLNKVLKDGCDLCELINEDHHRS